MQQGGNVVLWPVGILNDSSSLIVAAPGVNILSAGTALFASIEKKKSKKVSQRLSLFQGSCIELHETVVNEVVTMAPTLMVNILSPD